MSAHAGHAAATGTVLAAAHEPFRARRWAGPLMAVVDLAAVEISLLLGYLLRLAAMPWYPAEIGLNQLYGIAMGLLLLPLAQTAAGLFPGYGLDAVERLRFRMRTTFTVLATLIVWDYLVQHGGWSRGLLLATASYALVLPVIAERMLIRWLHARGFWGTPALILGTGATAAQAAERLRKQPYLGLVPVRQMDLNEFRRWNDLDGTPSIQVAVLAIPYLGQHDLTSILESLPFPKVIVVPEFSGLQSQWVTAVDLGGTLGLELQRNLLVRRNHWFKRALDVALGLPLFVVSIPLVVLLGLWVKRVSPGPALFVQEREGYGGRRIRVWKLRTMHVDAERRMQEPAAWSVQQRQEWERGFKLRDDPRVLPGVGSLLRRTSLDELPQLWNVLRGEMSLVGPRPFPYYHLQRFDPEFCRLRRRVRPGLTGLWQITERSVGDLRGQQALDTYYIRNWSFWMDIHILASTLRAVWKGTGAY